MESGFSTSSGLLERLRTGTGRPEAETDWREFVEVYGPLIERYLAGTGLSVPDAADVAQDTLVRVLRLMPRFRYDRGRGRFRDWLRRVTHNCRMAFLSRQPPEGLVIRPFPLESLASCREVAAWEEQFHARVFQAALEKVRPRFSPANWRAFERTWFEGRPDREVAGELGLKLAQVYLARSRALAAIRREAERISQE